MKKKIMAFCLLLSCISIAKDVEGQARIGFSASFGIEGLSNINIDKLGTIQMFKTKVDPPKTHYLQDFIENIQKIDEASNKGTPTPSPIPEPPAPAPEPEPKPQIQPSPTPSKPVVKKTPKEIAKQLILRGVQLDSTLFDGYVKMNKIGTTIGAKVYGKTSRVGEDIEIYKVGKAKVFFNVDTSKFKMNNTVYFKGYDEKIVGLDKYRVEDNVDGKSSIQFDTDGVISPFNTKIKPELAYKASFGDRKEFLIAPGFSTNIINTDNHQLNLTANYYLSNYKKDKFDIDEVKSDLQDLAPGNMNVEYFKNWELGAKRDIQKGILDGKNGSIRAIGHPTGALYGENVVNYAMRKMWNALIDNSSEAGQKLKEIVERIRNNNGKATLDDIIKLADKKSQQELIALKDKFSEMYPKFLNEALQELGLTQTNREVSSYHLSQWIPNNYIDIIKELANKQSGETVKPKIQLRSASNNQVENKYGELEYLFPKDNFKGITTILGNIKFINSIDDLTKVFDKLQPNFGYFSNLSEGINNKEKEYEENKKECDALIKKNFLGYLKCKVIYNDAAKPLTILGMKGSYILSEYNKKDKGLMQNFNALKDEMLKNRDKINKTLDESIDLLKAINKDLYDGKNKSINDTIDELEKTKNDIQATIRVVSGDTFKNFNLTKIKSIIQDLKKSFDTIVSLKDVHKNYVSKINNVIGEFGTEMVKNATDIIFEPQNVPSFDMLLGLNIVKSEHDAVKYDYEKAILEKLKEDVYKPNDKGISHGLNVNLFYTHKNVPLYVNTNFDFVKYSKLNSKMTRVGLSNEIIYTPKEFSLLAKTGAIYKDIMLHDLSYSKFNIDTDIALKLNFAKSKWLFRPGIRYVGNFEYVNTKNSVVGVEIFDRDKDGNLIDKNGNSVDISKESRHKYGKDLKDSFKTKEVTSSSKWLKPTNTIIPTFDVVYSPKENISLEYNLLVPVKFVGENFDGIMIKNGLGLTIKF